MRERDEKETKNEQKRKKIYVYVEPMCMVGVIIMEYMISRLSLISLLLFAVALYTIM